MTDADQSSSRSANDDVNSAANQFQSSVSTLVSGVIVVAALALARATIIGPDADRSARLLLLLGGIGVPFSLMAVVSARSANKYSAGKSSARIPKAADRKASAIAIGFAAAAALTGAIGLMLLLGSASDADYRVPLWQIETEPVVTLIVGLAAIVLAASSRLGSGADGQSMASRRVVAIIGACVAMPMVRRLFGRAGDEGLSVGWTFVLLLFDIAALVSVAVVAYRGFGVGRDLPNQLRAARSAEGPPLEPPVEPV